MGIENLARIGRVLNHAIEKFARITVETFKGFNQNALLYGASGDDSPPLAEDTIILVKQDGTGKYSCVGVLTVSRGAKPGEKILYARDPNGAIVSIMAMLGDGSIKNPRSKLRGIEDFSLKSLRMWGNKSPTPPVFRSKLRGIKPKEI